MGSKNNFIKAITVFLIVSLIFAGCSRRQQVPVPKQQSAEGQKQSDKIPGPLKDIESSIENVIKELKGPAVMVEEQGAKEGQQDKGTQQKQGDQGKKEGQDQGKEGEQKKEGQQGQGGQQGAQQPDPWQKVNSTVNNLHYQWTSYMPDAVKMGANRNLIDNFSKALNSLTNTVITKNNTNTLLSASVLYGYVPDFYSLYKTKSSPEIKRIRHYTRSAMLNSMTANWTQAETDINNLKSSWSLYKNTIDKENQDNSNKLDFSIYELEKVVKERNQALTDIKGRVALSNVQTLEKSMSDEKGKGGGQGGGQSGGSSGSGG